MRPMAVTLAAGLAILCTAAPPVAADTVPVSRAAEHVGRETTIEGRVVATHASPLATVLAFAPNFAGFTATVLAADRTKFPPDFDQRLRDKLVRVTGRVTAYRGKPEMTIREPSQLLVIPAGGASPVPADAVSVPSPAASPSPVVNETTRTIALLGERLGALEARLAAVEHALELQARAAEAQPPAGLQLGATARVVRDMLGDPTDVVRAPDGGSAWLYDRGRRVVFDRSGRVADWEGF